MSKSVKTNPNIYARLLSDEKAVDRAYYLDCFAWEAIAYLLGFSYQHVHRLHSNALNKLHETEIDA